MDVVELLSDASQLGIREQLESDLAVDTMRWPKPAELVPTRLVPSGVSPSCRGGPTAAEARGAYAVSFTDIVIIFAPKDKLARRTNRGNRQRLYWSL